MKALQTPAAGSLVATTAALFMFLMPSVCVGQQTASSLAETNEKRAGSSARAAAGVDGRYRIGPGDLLSITTLDYPQLSSDAVRVDSNGMILLPLVDGTIEAGCHTEGELAADISKRYLKYLKEPQVKVFVKEYQSQTVAVIGAVNTPGRFQLQRRVQLLELLTFVNGPAERAGQTIQIIHTAGAPTCSSSPSATEDVEASVLVTLKLSETMRGNEKANPVVQPGDIITIPDAEQYYIIGNVAKPSAYPLKESVTLAQAIAMAGGTLPDTNTQHVRIVRHSTDGTSSELFVDLKATTKQQTAEVMLQPNDIVEVSKKSGMMMSFKTAFRTMVPALATTLPLRVIP
jgi:polysaccharide biosynthesis/export protein